MTADAGLRRRQQPPGLAATTISSRWRPRWDDRAIRACTDLGLAEMIASGVTTIADMYMATPTRWPRRWLASGISANLCCGGVQFGTDDLRPRHPPRLRGAAGADREVARLRTTGRFWWTPPSTAEYTSHHPLWQWMADYAQRSRAWGCTSTSPRPGPSTRACLGRYGKTPIQPCWTDYGVWDARAIAAHCVWTTEEDWAAMADKGVTCRPQPGVQPEAGLRRGPGPRHEGRRGQRGPGHRRGRPPTTTRTCSRR